MEGTRHLGQKKFSSGAVTFLTLKPLINNFKAFFQTQTIFLLSTFFNEEMLQVPACIVPTRILIGRKKVLKEKHCTQCQLYGFFSKSFFLKAKNGWPNSIFTIMAMNTPTLYSEKNLFVYFSYFGIVNYHQPQASFFFFLLWSGMLSKFCFLEKLKIYFFSFAKCITTRLLQNIQTKTQNFKVMICVKKSH